VLIGILSDTHDHADVARIAVELLGRKGAEFYIHCGDVGGQEVLDELAGKPAAFVWGNNDWDRRALQRYADGLGIACYGAMADLTLDGKRIAVLHGDDLRLKKQLLDGQRFDYLMQGHTHIPLDERVGKTRVINPGALYRAREKTVALLDTAADVLTFLTI
jgi:putative phosphoesterase